MFPIDPSSDDPVDAPLPYESAKRPAPAPAPVRPGPWASQFQELTVELGGEVVEFTHVRNNTAGQHVALMVSALAFAGFVVFVMPLMNLSGTGRVLWTIVGISILALAAMVTHTRVRTTRVRLDRVGLTIEQGTDLDHESIVILWSELAGVDLEAVSETDGRKGMCLRLRPIAGEPIDTLAGVGVGELNNVRRVISETLSRHRANPVR